MTILLTGATGFIGSHVLDALLRRGYSVRAVVRGRGRLAPREGLHVVRADLTETGALVDALRGCDAVIHTAAAYTFAPQDAATIRRVNVLGTKGLLAAARLAGVQRAVVTSSSAAVGPMRGNRPADERLWNEPHGSESAYHASKVVAERTALAARLPLVTVLPTAPLGAGDRRPTPTGRMVLDVIRGRIWGTLDGGMNVVDVDDVAWLHVAALERGRPGERYVAGGVNLPLAGVFRLIAEAAGRRPPSWRVPFALALAAGAVDELRGWFTARDPRAPLEGVRMGHVRMYAESAKAQAELGYRPSPIEPAVERAVAWFREHGYAA